MPYTFSPFIPLGNYYNVFIYIILFMCSLIKYIQLSCTFLKFHVNGIEIHMMSFFSAIFLILSH